MHTAQITQLKWRQITDKSKKDVIKSSDRVRMWNVGNKNPNATYYLQNDNTQSHTKAIESLRVESSEPSSRKQQYKQAGKQTGKQAGKQLAFLLNM